MQPLCLRNHNPLSTATRLLCAIALIVVGFAHHIPSAPGQPAADLSAYALPDGTLPVICQPSSGADDGNGKALFHSDCEFCRLAGAAVLPASADSWAISCVSTTLGRPVAHHAVVLQAHHAGTPTRGPPPALT